MIVRESIAFKRGKDPRVVLNIGTDTRIKNFLKDIANDFQLDKKHPDYHGYINMDIRDMDSDTADTFQEFIKNHGDYRKYAINLGIHFDPPKERETIFYDIDTENDWVTKPKIYEELIHKFHGRWSNDSIEIYKNPKSLRGFEPWTRGISDRYGNLWITDKRNTTHSEIMQELHELGKIEEPWYSSDDDNDIKLVGWQRQRNSNILFLAESYWDDDILEIGGRFRYFARKAKEKNPKFNFDPNKISDSTILRLNNGNFKF